MFKDRVLLVTGGTGSFGNAVVRRFLDSDVKEIRIFSRDEKKQDDMRHLYGNDKLKFYIGDVRDLASIQNAMRGVDFVFHAAALKQVPSCEFFPLEAVKTNILGTDNVLTAAIGAGVKKVICLSTDKAPNPVNAMGMSKALMEKVIVAKARGADASKITICCTRYGNVMGSRGSVIPLFIDQIKAGKDITITDPNMTRFLMNLDESVELVLYAFANGKNGDIFVQKAPACTVGVLADAVKSLFGAVKHPVKVIGSRHGERMYEILLSKEECVHAVDLGGFYRVPLDGRDLNYAKYFEEGDKKKERLDEFNSDNTTRLDVPAVKQKLLGVGVVKEELAGWKVVRK